MQNFADAKFHENNLHKMAKLLCRLQIQVNYTLVMNFNVANISGVVLDCIDY